MFMPVTGLLDSPGSGSYQSISLRLEDTEASQRIRIYKSSGPVINGTTDGTSFMLDVEELADVTMSVTADTIATIPIPDTLFADTDWLGVYLYGTNHFKYKTSTSSPVFREYDPDAILDQGLRVETQINSQVLLTEVPVHGVTPAVDNYSQSLCFSAGSGAGGTVDLVFKGETGNITAGELDLFLHLSRTV